MIVVGRFYCYTRDDLDDHFRRLQPNYLNLNLLATTRLDRESTVSPHIRASFRASGDDVRSNVTRVDERAEGDYSSIRVLPDKFLLNLIVFVTVL